ncbi:MAG: hypothetical protein PGN13_15315 [Patulibacter minatonensis]
MSERPPIGGAARRALTRSRARIAARRLAAFDNAQRLRPSEDAAPARAPRPREVVPVDGVSSAADELGLTGTAAEWLTTGVVPDGLVPLLGTPRFPDAPTADDAPVPVPAADEPRVHAAAVKSVASKTAGSARIIERASAPAGDGRDTVARRSAQHRVRVVPVHELGDVMAPASAAEAPVHGSVSLPRGADRLLDSLQGAAPRDPASGAAPQVAGSAAIAGAGAPVGGPAEDAASVSPSIDEMYEAVAQRLRDELVIERERRGWGGP